MPGFVQQFGKGAWGVSRVQLKSYVSAASRVLAQKSLKLNESLSNEKQHGCSNPKYKISEYSNERHVHHGESFMIKHMKE